MVLDDQIMVGHEQYRSFRESAVSHYHNGRSSTGLVRKRMSGSERLRRVGNALLLPFRSLRHTVSTLRLKNVSETRLVASTPYVFLLAGCHAAGEIVGCLAGPGRSPYELI